MRLTISLYVILISCLSMACGDYAPEGRTYVPDLDNPQTEFEQVGALARNNHQIRVSVHGEPGYQSLVVWPSDDLWRVSCLRHTVVQPMHDELWSILLDVSSNFTLGFSYAYDRNEEKYFLMSDRGKRFIPHGTGIHRAFILDEPTRPLADNVYLSDWPSTEGSGRPLLPHVVQFRSDYLTTSVTQRPCTYDLPRLTEELESLNNLLSPLQRSRS